MDHWIRGNTIGRGSSASVSTAIDTQTGEIFAVKSACISKSEFLKREKEILATLNSPHVISYKGYNVTYEDGEFLYNLGLEYAPGGCLSDLMVNRGGFLSESMIRIYVHQILLGLNYLHCNNIVHCDIKPQNVLVTDEGVKIADFGCAKRLDGSNTTITAGTPIYMAPEVARGEDQGFSSDIWALGCLIIEMAAGQAPWVGFSDPVAALYRIGFSDDLPEIPSFLSEELKNLVTKCLKKDPKERASATELLNHTFLVETIDEYEELNHFFSLGETPTSVLDQGLWDSDSDSETKLKTTQKNSSISGYERIKKLNKVSSNMPNWSVDETWVTVRGEDCEVMYGNESIDESKMGSEADDCYSTFSVSHGASFGCIDELELELEVNIMMGLDCKIQLQLVLYANFHFTKRIYKIFDILWIL